MIKSMTGFAKASSTNKAGKLSVEISAVNKRFLDINFSLPNMLFFLEHFIKKEIEKKITRGSIYLKFEFIPEKENIFSFLPDGDFLKKMKKAYEKLALDLGYSEKEISFDFLFKDEKLLFKKKIQNESEIKKLIAKTINEALKKLLEMKKLEGKNLLNDIEKRINLILDNVLFVQKKSPAIKKEFKDKIEKRLQKILKDSSIDIEDRVLKEAAIYAEKVDVTEEIVRLISHIEHFISFMKMKKTFHGRKLEFILQEIAREANTIVSKASNIEISKKVVDIKSEIEKIREQLQNIE